MCIKDIESRLSDFTILERTKKYLNQKNINNLINVGIQDILTSQKIYRFDVEDNKKDFRDSLLIDFEIMIEYCSELDEDKDYLAGRETIPAFNRAYCHFYKYLSKYIVHEDIEPLEVRDNLEEMFIFFTPKKCT